MSPALGPCPAEPPDKGGRLSDVFRLPTAEEWQAWIADRWPDPLVGKAHPWHRDYEEVE